MELEGVNVKGRYVTVGMFVTVTLLQAIWRPLVSVERVSKLDDCHQ